LIKKLHIFHSLPNSWSAGSLERLVIVHQAFQEENPHPILPVHNSSSLRKSSLPEGLTLKSKPWVKPYRERRERASVQLYQESFDIIVVPGQPFQVITEKARGNIKSTKKPEPLTQLDSLKSHFEDQILTGRKKPKGKMVEKPNDINESTVARRKSSQKPDERQSRQRSSSRPKKDTEQQKHQVFQSSYCNVRSIFIFFNFIVKILLSM